MVDDIFDPLIHLLRNAVDHGIELPAKRKAANKPEIGKIILKATHEGDSIVIEVSDDGNGIDPEVLRAKAIASNTMDRNLLQKMSHRELLGLIFLPGFSTAKEVSNLSGRGVGMDIVRKKIEEIGGNVGISTVKGKGTKFIIRLPLTLAIIQGLLIVVEGMYYVIPVASVEETVIIDPKNLKDINGTFALELRDKLIPILALKNFFYGLPFNIQDNTKEYCIVTKYGERQVGIIVSEVIGEQDIVIKPLNTKLIKSPGISAATIVGNGDIGYIIDTSQIISYFFKVGMKTQQEG
jgi:two-component system chemotaxis sensor kinase CheA